MPMRIRAFLIAALLGCVPFAGCAAPPVDVKAMVEEWTAYMQRDYVLRPNDEVTISLHPTELPLQPQTLRIPSSGTISLARIETPIVAVGKPIREFRRETQEAYRKVFRDDVIVQVSLTAMGVQSVYMLGELRRPGPVPYLPSMTLSQAIAAAGGFDYRAKLTDVRVIRAGPDRVPRTFRVNIDQVFHAAAGEGPPDFLLLPGDVVYCQSVWVAELADALNLYLWSLLPFRSPSGLTGAGL